MMVILTPSASSSSIRTAKPTELHLTIGNRILMALFKSSRLADIRKELLLLLVEGITADALQENLDMLVKEGLVTVVKEGRCIYTLTEKGKVHALSLLFALGMQDQDFMEFIDMLPKLTLRRVIQLLAVVWTFYKRRNDNDNDADASEELKVIERLQNEAEDLYDFYTDTRLAVLSPITDEQLREGNVIYGDLLINLPFKDRIYLLELFVKVMDMFHGLSRKERRFFRDVLKVLKDTCNILYNDGNKGRDTYKV